MNKFTRKRDFLDYNLIEKQIRYQKKLTKGASMHKTKQIISSALMAVGMLTTVTFAEDTSGSNEPSTIVEYPSSKHLKVQYIRRVDINPGFIRQTYGANSPLNFYPGDKGYTK